MSFHPSPSRVSNTTPLTQPAVIFRWIMRHGVTLPAKLCCGSAIRWPRRCTATVTFAPLGEMPPLELGGCSTPAMLQLILVHCLLRDHSPIDAELAVDGLLVAVD